MEKPFTACMSLYRILQAPATDDSLPVAHGGKRMVRNGMETLVREIRKVVFIVSGDYTDAWMEIDVVRGQNTKVSYIFNLTCNLISFHFISSQT